MNALRCACALALLLTAGPLRAQGDPLKSPACGAALERLQSARAGRDGDGAQVEALRSAAANACLGTSAVPSRPSRALQAPIAVPPPQIDVAPAPAPPVAMRPAPLPPPPVAIERFPAPATCDANGCWTNDGSHLRHVPPNLSGPGGLCTQQGGQVYCP